MVDGDLDVLFQLELRRKELCRLCATWRSEVQVIQCAYPMPASWGPSEHELIDATLYEITESADFGLDTDRVPSQHVSADDDSGSDDGFHDPGSDAEGELLEAAEAVAMTDVYRALEDDLVYSFRGAELADHTVLFPAESSSPKKRRY